MRLVIENALNQLRGVGSHLVVMRVGELLVPLVAAMRQDLLGQPYLQADETTVPVQMHDKRGADHQAYLWQYGKPGGETVFDFCLGRGREGPRKFLDKWEVRTKTRGEHLVQIEFAEPYEPKPL